MNLNINNHAPWGRAMTIGKVIFDQNTKEIQKEIGVGACFFVHLGYCHKCGERIALNLAEMSRLLEISHLAISETEKGHLGANFRSRLITFVHSIKGQGISDPKSRLCDTKEV